MSNHSLVRFSVLLAVFFCIPSIAFSQWVENGVPVVSETFPQSSEVAVSDGAGGSYVVWVDLRQYPWQMLTAQHVNEGGEVTWISDGIQVCGIDTLQIEPSACLGADGSLYVAWSSIDGSTARAMAQRILPNGTLAWGLDGVELDNSLGSVNDVMVCPGFEGGAVFAWLVNHGVNTQVRVNSLNTEGNSVWGGGGYQLTTSPVDKAELCLAPDGLGGAYLAWVDLNNEDVFAEWILFDGTVWWGGGAGTVVCNAINAQINISMIADGAGGVIVSWTDTRTDSLGDIYAQKIEPTHGTPVWSTGAPVCTNTSAQGLSQLVSDGQGGAYVVWLDSRDQAYDLYVQKLNGSGNGEWAGNGVPLCDVDGFKYGPVVMPDGTGGMIAAWQDARSGSTSDVYAQRVDANMNFLWDSDGLPVCTETLDQIVSSVIPDGEGGATFVWSDDRFVFDTDVYAQKIDRFGKWGFPGPYVVSIRDVPGDQGGQVRISWYASRLDIDPLSEIFYYSIWRAIDATQATKMIAEGATVWEEGTTLKADSPEPTLRQAELQGEPYFWTKVGEVESSRYIDTYAAMVPTLFDSTATSAEPHYFQVIAHGHVTPEHWFSEVVAGRSVDNLAPETPTILAGSASYDPSGLEIVWAQNQEPDLHRYELYRSTDPAFVPGPGNLVAATADTNFFDTGWSTGPAYHYKLAAIDSHDNRSGYAELSPSGLAGTGDTVPVPGFGITETYPNPFNPSVRIRYEVSGDGLVDLSVFDVLGRHVATLVHTDLSAGRKTAVWNGTDGTGRRAASGTYFLRLQSEQGMRVRKVMLAK